METVILQAMIDANAGANANTKTESKGPNKRKFESIDDVINSFYAIPKQAGRERKGVSVSFGSFADQDQGQGQRPLKRARTSPSCGGRGDDGKVTQLGKDLDSALLNGAMYVSNKSIDDLEKIKERIDAEIERTRQHLDKLDEVSVRYKKITEDITSAVFKGITGQVDIVKMTRSIKRIVRQTRLDGSEWVLIATILGREESRRTSEGFLSLLSVLSKEFGGHLTFMFADAIVKDAAESEKPCKISGKVAIAPQGTKHKLALLRGDRLKPTDWLGGIFDRGTELERRALWKAFHDKALPGIKFSVEAYKAYEDSLCG